MAIPYGITRVIRLMSGWGVKYFDYDNDGDLDLLVANGHPDDKIEEHSSEVKYCEPMLLFHGNGKRLERLGFQRAGVYQALCCARLGDWRLQQ